MSSCLSAVLDVNILQGKNWQRFLLDVEVIWQIF